MADRISSYPTNDVRTTVNFDTGGVTVEIPAKRITRRGGDIGNGVLPGMPVSQDVYLLESGFWVSMPHAEFSWQTHYSLSSGFRVRKSEMETGTHMVENPQFRHPSEDLPGISLPSGVESEADYSLEKSVPAGEGWDQEIPTDTPEPQTTQTSSTVTVDVNTHAVARSLLPYMANMPFTIGFSVPEGSNTQHTLFIFHFGGPASVMPPSEVGGQFALRVQGNGSAILYEYNQYLTPPWQERHTFKWANSPSPKGGYYELTIYPHTYDFIQFQTRGAEYTTSPSPLDFYVTSASSHSHPWGKSLYEDGYAITGHRHSLTVTGAGPILLRLAANYNQPISITKTFHPKNGRLVTGIFSLPDMPADTFINLRWTAYLPPDTSITAVMYDATTHAALGTDLFTGNYLSNFGQRNYYVIFTFHNSSNQFFSPQLRSVTVKTPVFAAVEAADIKTGGFLQEIEITGPDLWPDHDSASITIKDPRNAVGDLLTKRGRIRTQVDIVNPTLPTDDDDYLVTRVFDGETGAIRGQRIGNRSGRGYEKEWRDFEGAPLIGMWARLADQVNIGLMNFNDSDDKDDQGRPLPLRMTVVVRTLFNAAGFTDDQIIIPTYLDPIRFWPNGTNNKEDYTVAPGQSYTNILHRIINDYLGHYLVWDPNAGVLPLNPGGGSWRLLANPTGNTLSVWNFVTERPSGWTTPRLAYLSESYGIETSPIEQGSYFEADEPPEFNYISVTTSGQLSPSMGGQWLAYSNSLQNRASVFGSRDPDVNPDYLGRWVPVHVVDPFIGGKATDPRDIQRAVDIATYRYFFFGAFGRHRKTFTASLKTIWGPDDNYQLRKRPIRVNDIIKVDGVKHIVRSADIAYNDDRNQQIHIDCYKARFG